MRNCFCFFMLFFLFQISFAEDVKIISGPDYKKTGKNYEINFEVSAFTNVEVSILDENKKVVKHLVAGVLGTNAPKPFMSNSKKQQILWDGTDDKGQLLSGSNFQVSLRIGLTPVFEKSLGVELVKYQGEIYSVTVDDNGNIYMLLGQVYRGQAQMKVYDKNGKYLRTIMPFSNSIDKSKLKDFEPLTIDGKFQPKVFNGQGNSLYPLVAGIRGQKMAWHPKGYLIGTSAVGTMANHGPPRFLLAFDKMGGAPTDISYVGPEILGPRGFIGGSGEGSSLGEDSVALSPDGKWIYYIQNIVGGVFEKSRKHGVYRVSWQDKIASSLWLGTDVAGDSDKTFNTPSGVTVDAQGNVYVSDRGNNKIKIYNASGEFLSSINVESPVFLEVHKASGKIYVISRPEGRLYDVVYKQQKEYTSKLYELTPITPLKEYKETAVMTFLPKKTCIINLAIDQSEKETKLYIIEYEYGGNSLFILNVKEGKFEKSSKWLERGGLDLPSFVAADPERNKVYVREHLKGVGEKNYEAIELTTGKISIVPLKVTDIALDQEGNIYAMGGYNSNALFKYGPDYKVLPFSATNSNKLDIKFRSYGPDMGIRGHVIAPNGDIYIRRSTNHALICTTDVYSPDGSLKKADIVRGLGSGDAGIGVDNQGNIYLGINIKDPAKPFPAEFMSQISKEPWFYYKDADKRNGYNAKDYCNTYLFHMGSIFKFSSAGGKIYGNANSEDLTKNPDMKVESAPEGAVSFKSSYLAKDLKVTGYEWYYNGVGIIPASFDRFTGDDGCTCLVTHFDTDYYGRSYAPSVFRSSVEWIDNAGNLIAHIGSYGNIDDVLTAKTGDTKIPMAWPCSTDYAEYDGKLYLSDSVNRCILVIQFKASVEKTILLK